MSFTALKTSFTALKTGFMALKWRFAAKVSPLISVSIRGGENEIWESK